MRWARLGVWERLLALVQWQGLPLGMTFLSGTHIRAYPKTAGAGQKRNASARRGRREALGRS